MLTSTGMCFATIGAGVTSAAVCVSWCYSAAILLSGSTAVWLLSAVVLLLFPLSAFIAVYYLVL
ncbi:hypothetical protein GGR56DRAFT_633695 [Xylariaceae sp. FL0804]|nr:hypothetical protein GGR56DRAFT_633695 [Xylariaceae sp. FL0804]